MDLNRIRAVCEEAAKKGYFMTADVEREFREMVTPTVVLALLDSAKNMGLDADHAREERDRTQATVQALRTVVQNTMALGLITEDQPLLLARARAALGETK